MREMQADGQERCLGGDSSGSGRGGGAVLDGTCVVPKNRVDILHGLLPYVGKLASLNLGSDLLDCSSSYQARAAHIST